MADNSPQRYEALFLLNQTAYASDQAGVVKQVGDILAKTKAKVHVLRKWDERKLAYTLGGQKRGTFYIAYFEAAPSTIVTLERECNLSDVVLRTLVTRADHIGDAELQAAISAKPLDEVRAAAAAAAAAAPTA